MRRFAIRGLPILVVLTLAAPLAFGEKKPRTWRIEMANDTIFGSDNQFTNGFYVSHHSPVYSSVDDVRGTLAFGRWMARGILPDRDDLNYRKGFSFGQNMQTPEVIEDPNIILNDVPYAGMLGMESSWICFNDKSFTGFQFLLGLVGPDTFADDIQAAVHDVIDSVDPRGWNHQLDNEPIANFYYARKHKFLRSRAFDIAGNFDVMAGNFITAGEVSLETRIGRVPQGFTYIPDPLGRGIAYDATLPREDGKRAIYGSVVTRATGIGDTIFLDGNHFTDNNQWTENNVLEREDFVAQVIVGLHYVGKRFGVHLNWWFGSDTVDDATLDPNNEDPSNDFGTFMFEWRGKGR